MQRKNTQKEKHSVSWHPEKRERERERTFLRGRSRGLLLEIVVQEDSELEWGKFSSIETSRPWQTTKAWKQLQKGIPMENG